MWNSTKSVRLSLICTRLVIVLLILCALFLPKIVEWYKGYYTNISLLPEADLLPLMMILYSCSVPAMAALICLDRLLLNIRKGEVFRGGNVRFLRIISWCCFAVSLIIVCGIYYYGFCAVMAIIAAFMGLILRVVKNVIEQAVEIKRENDFTI